jgi:hypothetical protein
MNKGLYHTFSLLKYYKFHAFTTYIRIYKLNNNLYNYRHNVVQIFYKFFIIVGLKRYISNS